VKKALKIIGIAAIVLIVGGYAFLSWNAEKSLSEALPEALALVESDTAVTATYDENWVVLKPNNVEPTVGVIVYPGAYCDVRGYGPLLRPMAEAGYLVIGAQMPFYFSIFAPNEADNIRAAFPEIEKWVIVGHSMGGAMAGMYGDNHRDDLAGIVFWDSYPPTSNDLSDIEIPVMHIHRARPDGSLPQKFIDNAYLSPESATWVGVPGGIHMYFGAFGEGVYEEEWEASISSQAQWEIANAAMLDFLSKI